MRAFYARFNWGFDQFYTAIFRLAQRLRYGVAADNER